ncbi:sensor histidine kinase [Halobacterium yunchengense]|uniref:sensor histidine kinase n=1 Tax=Halobacterium yunchengense TaxID=3108497 RepID=UPI0030083280
MTDDHSASIPMAAFPQPVVRYVLEDDRPLVAATNSAFEDAFGDDAVGSAVADLLDQVGASDRREDGTVAARVARGEDIDIVADGDEENRRYRVRVVDAGDDGRFLVFSAVGGEGGAVDPVGVGEVASVLSHDLRNPLDVAKAHLRAAEETGDREHFDAVADAHDRMTEIIRDVLTLARGDAAVEPGEEVDLREVVADAWQSVDTQSAELNVAGELPVVSADAGRVRRLFENLFRNAVEHGRTARPPAAARAAGEDAAVVTVTVGALDEEGFYVADDGRGVPSGEREAVFAPGYTRTEDGTGLGLAIVERVVDAHGWDLELTASETGGARFEVRCGVGA